MMLCGLGMNDKEGRCRTPSKQTENDGELNTSRISDMANVRAGIHGTIIIIPRLLLVM